MRSTQEALHVIVQKCAGLEQAIGEQHAHERDEAGWVGPAHLDGEGQDFLPVGMHNSKRADAVFSEGDVAPYLKAYPC